MSEKTPIDIEALVQWAIAHSVAPRLTVASPRELMFNHGYTAVPKGFHGVFAGAMARVEGGRLATDIDAERVLAAIDRLDPFTRSIVLVNAKTGRRPDWMEGVEPKRIAKRVYQKRRGKKRHRPSTVIVWDVEPAAICAARELYGRWHSALTGLARTLSDQLIAWQVNGLNAPAAPWDRALEKAA